MLRTRCGKKSETKQCRFIVFFFFKNCVYSNIFSNRPPPPPPEDGYFDEDVEQEKERVKNMLPSQIAETNLVLDRVTKFYKRFVAVNQISLAVRQ